jgi:sugar lactone lactonase YvrE
VAAVPASAAPTHPLKEGGGIPGLDHACGTAVDSEGDLYASSAGTDEIKVYDPSHAEIASIENTNDPCGLAVTTTGVLYVSESATGEVVSYEPDAYPLTGAPVYGPRKVIDASGNAKGIAVDPVDDRLYVAAGSSVAVYKADGNPYQVSEQQTVAVESATGGTFTLEFEGQETAGIPYNASAAEAQAALEALATIGAGNVKVEIPGSSYIVDFVGVLASADVPALVADGTGLTGGGEQAVTVKEAIKGFNGHFEGGLANATGVAAYTYTNTFPSNRRLYLAVAEDGATDQVKVLSGPSPERLKLRRTITGVDEDDNPDTPEQKFGFGAAGAYLAADAGNEDAVHKCNQVAAQSCTAGHFFLHDAENEAVDEFDATGEFLVQFGDGLADAGPTQVAVDRSGGADDGTIYAGSGAAAGAEILGFEPLSMPGRAAAPALSRALSGAVAVTTDCNGNVYVASGTTVRVFDPEGTELTSFTDGVSGGPQDLGVDCAGHVYVVDGNALMTYYTPSSNPPTAATTYTRHEPALTPSAAFPLEGGMVAVAVNPANDHAFVLRKSQSGSSVFELGPAAKGSPEVGHCAKGLLFGVVNLDIDVYGLTGEVYVSTNGKNVGVAKCGAEPELIRRLQGGGCPSGELGPNPAIAVDQSNGHIVAYANNQPGDAAREYDSAGACLAEFGHFLSAPGAVNYKVAVDSSCALHDPPLTEQTTPTCASFSPANGTAYVAWDSPDAGQPYDVTAFGPLSYGDPPVVETGGASDFGPAEARLNGTVNPANFEVEDCAFEYLTDAEYQENLEEEKPAFEGALAEECVETAETIGQDSEPVSVHAEIGGVEPETTRYRFRLVAQNKFGPSAGSAGLFGPPVPTTGNALPIGYDEATLRGEVDPSGLATTYRFQYGTEEGVYDQSTPAVELAAGDGAVAVKAPVLGLEEGTQYHFRLVAKNDATAQSVQGLGQSFETLARRGQRDCPNVEYRTGLSANLPDCRAYELVTPADTHGIGAHAGSAGVFSNRFNSWWVAPRGEGAGESVAYTSILPGFDGTGLGDGFVAQRDPGPHPKAGWASELRGLSFGQTGGSSPLPGGVSADQRYWLWGNPGAELPTEETLPPGNYLRVPSGLALPACSPDPGLEFELVGCASSTDPDAEGRYVSAGGAHVIFTSQEHLGADAAPEGTEAIYDRSAGGASAQVLSVKPDDSAFGVGEDATYVASTEDGTAVVFSVDGALYVHREGKTKMVAEAPSTFDGISADGERVFFMDATYPASSKPVPPAGLFACDVEEGPCAGPGANPPTEIAEESIFVHVSADGSHAFFTSKVALTEAGEENENGEHAEEGEDNLYAWDGSGTSFVGSLVPADLDSFNEEPRMDLRQWTNVISGQFIPSSLDHIGRAFSPTRSTPDGEAFVFQSHAQLTAYDNGGKGEIYRYAPAGPGVQLICVSCDPGGAPAGGDALLQSFEVTEPTALTPNITDDGRSVFFESPDQLLPEDANDATDVYQWRAMGAGTGVEECKRAAGCLALISAGQGELSSNLYGMTADGHDVFFGTLDKLVGADIPDDPSLYDARVEGGIPDPPAEFPCRGDACQPPGAPPPVLPQPASTGPGSNGERSPGACAKGKRRVKGRCVPRPCPKGKHRVKGRCVAKHNNRKRSKHAGHRANHDRGARR